MVGDQQQKRSDCYWPPGLPLTTSPSTTTPWTLFAGVHERHHTHEKGGLLGAKTRGPIKASEYTSSDTGRSNESKSWLLPVLLSILAVLFTAVVVAATLSAPEGLDLQGVGTITIIWFAAGARS
jgi:hypothetical protein